MWDLLQTLDSFTKATSDAWLSTNVVTALAASVSTPCTLPPLALSWAVLTFSLHHPFTSSPPPADSAYLMLGFQPPEAEEKGTEDEFDPIPVLISKNSNNQGM